MYKPLPKILSYLRPFGNKTLWKYMSLDKFIYMIENKVIFLPRADINPIYFEGRFLNYDKDRLLGRFEKDGMACPKEKAELAINVFQNHKRCTYFDSWQINDYECHAMWKIFGKDNNSVALKTDIKRLKKVYNNKKESDVLLTKVEYYKPTDGIKLYNNILLFIRKPISFSYEKEIRGIIQHKYQYESENHQYPSNEIIPINDFHSFISEIILSPTSCECLLNEINRSLHKNGIKDIKISNSIYHKNNTAGYVPLL
jgi:hypothetical protein